MDIRNDGEVLEILCAHKFLQNNFIVSKPLITVKYDLIVDKNNKIWRIQIKTAKALDNAFHLSNIRHKSVNGKRQKVQYSANEVDFICTVFENELYLVPIDKIGKTIVLRLKNPKNNNKNVHYAKDYHVTQY